MATVLLLPGLLCDATVFAAQAEALARHCKVAIADFSREDSIAAMARSALSLRAGPVVAVGHSMGGRVALEMVRSAPDRVAGLCLMDTGIAPRRDGEEAQRQILVDLAFSEGMRALAARWLPPMVHEARVADAPFMAALTEMVAQADPERHQRQIRALLDRPDARGVLPSIRCPTLVMVGRQDRWSPLAQHEEIARLTPDAELAVVEDSGHMAPVERPEPVTKALLDWLARHDLLSNAAERGESFGAR